jgi:hypothetical protein
MGLLMIQKNIFLMFAVIYFSSFTFSEELLTYEDASKFFKANFINAKYDICDSVKYENFIKSENEDYITYSVALLKDTGSASKELDPPAALIRKPTSVVIQEEHSYRENYRKKFQERTDEYLIILNKSASISAKQYKKLKSKAADLEAQLRQGEEKLCSKSEKIVP